MVGVLRAQYRHYEISSLLLAGDSEESSLVVCMNKQERALKQYQSAKDRVRWHNLISYVLQFN